MKIEGSSHLERAEYDETHRMLVVGFKGGATYSFQNVPAEKWKAFQEAPSKGSYLASEIKPHHRSWPAKSYNWKDE